MKSEIFEVDEPEWLKGSRECETCGHWATFEAGFATEDGEYVEGWYRDDISCFESLYYDPEVDTLEEFRSFLQRVDFMDEAKELLKVLEGLE